MIANRVAAATPRATRKEVSAGRVPVFGDNSPVSINLRERLPHAIAAQIALVLQSAVSNRAAGECRKLEQWLSIRRVSTLSRRFGHRLIQAPKLPISPDAARYLLAIDFSEADHIRMHTPMDKSSDGALTTEETAELNGYVNVANVLSIMHSRARVALNQPGFDSLRGMRSA